jgi:hypothetical protein
MHSSILIAWIHMNLRDAAGAFASAPTSTITPLATVATTSGHM